MSGSRTDYAQTLLNAEKFGQFPTQPEIKSAPLCGIERPSARFDVSIKELRKTRGVVVRWGAGLPLVGDENTDGKLLARELRGEIKGNTSYGRHKHA